MLLAVMGFWAAELRAETVVAFGDSTTAGTPGFRSPLEAPPAGQGNPESQYLYWVQKQFPDWKFLNRGINGERSDRILRRFDRDVKGAKADMVIVMAGVVDLYQGYSAAYVEKNLEAIYKKAIENKMTVLACTILPYNEADKDTMKEMADVNAWIRDYAAKNGLLFCDTYKAAENPQKPGKLAGSPDGLHPDPATYRKIGGAVAEALKEKYERK